jgi:putative chitinase
MITSQQLKNIMPGINDPQDWEGPLSFSMTAYEIINPPRKQMFISQIALESGEFNHLEENMNYSAFRLVKVWPNRFPTVKSAEPYARNPEALANKVYSNRMGNGTEQSGDGWRYHGRGLIQLTGKDNYKTIGGIINMPEIVEDPEMLLDRNVACLSAAAFWEMKGLNEIADKDDLAAYMEVTKKINGGLTGLSERLEYWRRAKIHII